MREVSEGCETGNEIKRDEEKDVIKQEKRQWWSNDGRKRVKDGERGREGTGGGKKWSKKLGKGGKEGVRDMLKE